MSTRTVFCNSFLSVVVGAMLLTGCENPDNSGKMMDKPAGGQMGTLYSRLGGEPAIKAVVDDFVAMGASDPKVNFTRKGTPKEWNATPENVDHLKKMLVQFIGMATGGPQKYEGRGMKEAHAGMQITNAEFDALAADLQAALTKNKVPPALQGELMAIVGTTRKDIVEK